MATTSVASRSFDRPDDRNDEMHRTIEDWVDELVQLVDEAAASEEFREWLDVKSRFHDYSYRNTLLIKLQHPGATKLAGYRRWQEEFDRHVVEGESAIWIWAPIIAKRCPVCENSPSYHDKIGCDYDETRPEQWDRGLVGFKPVPVFDVSQTEGEPLPELETAASGEAEGLVSALQDVAGRLGVDVNIVAEEEWEYGDAEGVCRRRSLMTMRPIVEARARSTEADLAVTLIHEYAHARLHFDVDKPIERTKREVEAEAVAYVVGRYFGLDTSRSAFYLAAWRGEDSKRIQERLDRISGVAEEFIDTIPDAD